MPKFLVDKLSHFLPVFVAGLIFSTAAYGQLFDREAGLEGAALNPAPHPPTTISDLQFLSDSRDRYRAMLVSCAAPGQCIVMSVGDFTTIADCQERLELVRQFKIMGKGQVLRRDNRPFCALPKIGDNEFELLDFIYGHLEELAPHIDRIIKREKAGG